jgi:hypothetical protein
MIPTICLKLTQDQERALMELHRYNFYAISSLSTTVLNEISGLERVLSDLIGEIGGIAFLKCGRKSCMDYVTKLENKNTKRLLEDFTSQAHRDLVVSRAHKSVVCDTALSLWCQVVSRTLAVTNGFDAVQTLSGSMLASFALSPASGSTLYVRQFVEINPCLEFRVYIYNEKITGITQKRAICSNYLIAHHTSIFSKIICFVEKHIIPNMSDYESFCADVIAFPERKREYSKPTYSYQSEGVVYKSETAERLHLKLSQLIPFYPRAVVGLFDWGKDRNILMNGPLDIRFNRDRTNTLDGTIRFHHGAPLIAKFWLDIIQQKVRSQLWWDNVRWWVPRMFLMLALILGTALSWFSGS